MYFTSCELRNFEIGVEHEIKMENETFNISVIYIASIIQKTIQVKPLKQPVALGDHCTARLGLVCCI
jgi:hypothetical protein